MPKKLVVDVGNCVPDHSAIKRMIQSNFDAEVVACEGPEDALSLARNRTVALFTVNRKLDRDYSDGLEVVRQFKADPHTSAIPVMLVTNYPEYQQQAVALGAELGFGKLELNTRETHARLGRYLVASEALSKKQSDPLVIPAANQK